MNLVLIIDDEESLRDGCRQTLEKSGYTVLTAGEGV
jgi:DNA-binding response OmpR family regulator